EIAAELAQALAPLQAKLVQPLGCYEAKRFIANSRFLLSSRFHGLVNGLSQRVPSMAIGWTHKYDGILEIYGQQKYSLYPGMVQWERVVEDFLNDEAGIRAELRTQQLSIEETVYPRISREIAKLASASLYDKAR